MAQSSDSGKAQRHSYHACGDDYGRHGIGHVCHVGVESGIQIGGGGQFESFFGEFRQYTHPLEERGYGAVALQFVAARAADGDPSGCQCGDLIPESGGAPVGFGIGRTRPVRCVGHGYGVAVCFDIDSAPSHHFGGHVYVWHRPHVGRQDYTQRRGHYGCHHHHGGYEL